jgi:hypothetical protein
MTLNEYVKSRQVYKLMEDKLKEIRIEHKNQHLLIPKFPLTPLWHHLLGQFVPKSDVLCIHSRSCKTAEVVVKKIQESIPSWWITFQQTTCKQLIRAYLLPIMNASTQQDARILVSRTQAISTFYPGFTFGCDGNKCEITACQLFQKQSTQCPISQLCSQNNRIIRRDVSNSTPWNIYWDEPYFSRTKAHFSWKVIAITNQGKTLWLQNNFECITFPHIDPKELAIYCMNATVNEAEVFQWKLNLDKTIRPAFVYTEVNDYYQPGVINVDVDPFSSLIINPHYYKNQAQVHRVFRALQDVENAYFNHDTLPHIWFKICEYAIDFFQQPDSGSVPLRHIGNGIPNYIQFHRFWTLNQKHKAQLMVNEIGVERRRQLKRKASEVAKQTFVNCGNNQWCNFNKQVRYYDYEIWRTGGNQQWIHRDRFNNISWTQRDSIVPVDFYSAPLPAQYSLIAYLGWTPSRSLFLFTVIAFQICPIVVMTRQATLQLGKEFAQQFIDFLQLKMKSIRDPGTGIHYISVPDPIQRDNTYIQLATFFKQQQLDIFQKDQNEFI